MALNTTHEPNRSAEHEKRWTLESSPYNILMDNISNLFVCLTWLFSISNLTYYQSPARHGIKQWLGGERVKLMLILGFPQIVICFWCKFTFSTFDKVVMKILRIRHLYSILYAHLQGLLFFKEFRNQSIDPRPCPEDSPMFSMLLTW